MVLVVVDDLLFSSKIRSAAAGVGATTVFARSLDAVLAQIREQAPPLVIVDLDRDALDPVGIIRAIRAEPGKQPRIVGFVSHVRAERIAEAREAGCDQAMARSGFVVALSSLLAGTVEAK